MCKCIITHNAGETDVDYELGFNVTYSIPGFEFNTSIFVDCSRNCIDRFAQATNDIDFDFVPNVKRSNGKPLGQMICDVIEEPELYSTVRLHAVIDWLKPDNSQEAYVSSNALAISYHKLACIRKHYLPSKKMINHH